MKHPDYRALAPRYGLVLLASPIFALSHVMNLQADVGQAPWVAFAYGFTLHTPLTFGMANIAISFVIIAISWALGVKPGIATVISIALVGWCIDWLLLIEVIPRMQEPISAYSMLLFSVWIMGLGTSFMVKANLGVGPRDSLMLAVTALMNRPVGLVKGGIELTALTLGFLMGAPIWLGTLVYALTTGPAVGFWFRVFGIRSPRRKQAVEDKVKPSVRRA